MILNSDGTIRKTLISDYFCAKRVIAAGSVDLSLSQTPMGNLIRLYDKERCICDLIRDRKHTDMQIYSQGIKEYFNRQPFKTKDESANYAANWNKERSVRQLPRF